MAATGDGVVIDLPDQPKKVARPARAAAWLWWLRGALAIVLYFWTMYSVTGGLTKVDEKAGAVSA